MAGGVEAMRAGQWNALREPALWVGLLSALVVWVPPLITHVSPVTAGVINAAIVALAGAATAALVHDGKLAPALLGAIQAILALGLGLGLHIPQTVQTEVVAAASALIAAFVRTQVTALPPVAVPLITE